MLIVIQISLLVKSIIENGNYIVYYMTPCVLIVAYVSFYSKFFFIKNKFQILNEFFS